MKRSVCSIIVTYNGAEWVDKCVRSVLKSNIESHKVVVIDNGSTDRTVEIIKSNYPSVRLIEMSKNLGFGRANNVGLSIALENSYDYAFLLNQDAWVYESTIQKLVQVASSNPKYGLISPLHLTGEGDRLDGSFQNCIHHKKCPQLCSDAILSRKLSSVYETNTLIAASWLMSRETLETVGGFDPIFFHYGEDNNYVQRVRYHGLKVGVCPHSKIHHDRENRTRKTVYESRKFAINSMIKYANVNENGPRKMSDKIWKLRLRLVYYLLTLKGSWKITYDKLDTLASIADDVRESWQKNKKSGPHYLDISSVENI